ncbi:MAG TPA: mechanosensitive ion channel family protein [Acidimicrobiales bacterium]
MLLQDIPPAPEPTTGLAAACGEEDPSFICEAVWNRWENERWAELADIVFAKPLKILLIIAIAWLVNRLARRAIASFATSITDDQQATKRIKRRLRGTSLGSRLPASVLATGALDLRAHARAETLGYVLRSIATFVVWTIAVITILGELGINLGPLIAGAGIAGVALGFGAQSLVKDFLAGMFILIEDQYGVGDIVDVGEADGVVEAVSLRTTRLRDVSGTMWHVPNGQILRVGNMSQKWARALLDVEVAYGTDIDQAKQVIKDVADQLWRDPAWAGKVLEEPEIWGVEAVAVTGIVIRLVIKTKPAEQWAMMRELRKRLKDAFDAEGIEIPMPQSTVWVHRDAGSSTESASGDDSTDPEA